MDTEPRSRSDHDPPLARSAGRLGGASIPARSRTPLVGRRREMAAIRALLARPDVPLVTLTGPGGVGKTRVALAVAGEAGDVFPDGARVVELAALRDPELVLPTIAAAFGLGDRGILPVFDQLVVLLRPRRSLLVLDNLEQVVEAAPRIVDLLAVCPMLTVLATSRVVLNVSGEHDVPIDPLPLPEAVQLFGSRAKAADASYALTAANAPDVAAICARLDGLPLAIELAAARIPALPAAALLSRLDRPLPLLTGGPRDQPDRLRTLRGAIAWSYDLLDGADQTMFRRFSVFAGGFELAAVQSICRRLSEHDDEDGPGDPSVAAGRLLGDPVALLDRITSLVEKSLIRLLPELSDGEPRYRMLETVRGFGAELLAASDEGPRVLASHADTFLEIAERASEQLGEPGYKRVLDRLDTEHDNIRTALTWACEHDDVRVGLGLASAMARYWAVRGHYREGRRWLERSLALGSPAAAAADRGGALRAAGWLARLQGDTDAAADLQSEAITVSRAIQDAPGLAAALQELGLVEMHRGDHGRAVTLMEEALALNLTHEVTEPHGPELVSVTYANLAQVALAWGRLDRAAPLADEAIRRQRALGYGWALGDTLRIAGDIASGRGNHEQALAAYRESVELTRRHGDPRFLTNALAGIAEVAATRADLVRAARVYAAVAALREQMGAGIEAWQVARHERALATVRSALPADTFAAAWSSGASMTMDEVITAALSGAAPATPTNPAGAPDPVTFSGLTAREIEVLRLIADGLSDREIADRLSISPRTVGGHVSNILGKLGVDSRTAALRHAARHGFT